MKTLFAPAKINLGLSILGRRPDGFHNLLSVFQTIDLGDDLSIESAQTTSLMCNDPSISLGADNLVLKAEAALRGYNPDLPPSRFHLTKRIPVGGGLGGGSSDAAAALLLLRSYHGLTISDVELSRIAAHIGSDIPFLLSTGAAVVTGRGEMIETVEWPFSFVYVLVHPGFGVSTAWAYRSLPRLGATADRLMPVVEGLRTGSIDEELFLDAIVNDFEEPVFAEYPVLGQIGEELAHAGALRVVMSGSGSTIVGICSDMETARHCADSLVGEGRSIFIARPYHRSKKSITLHSL